MNYQVLINDTVKEYLLGLGSAKRRQLHKAFEFLESGLWDGGLRVKKLRALSQRAIMEGRLNQSERLLFTLGKGHTAGSRDIYVWGIVRHEHVDQKAQAVVPHNAPFLNFETYTSRQLDDVDFDELRSDCLTQESVHSPTKLETGHQRWFVLDEQDWRRLLLYEKGDFEIFLYLTPEQQELLEKNPPLVVSGTAGSGKSTLTIYYLLRPDLHGKWKIFLTYNRHLRNFSERLYRGLSTLTEIEDPNPPLFLTFKDLCRQLVSNVDRRFPLEREVDVFGFKQLLRKHARSEKFDYALVWEEIRSIIKGAKPQINTDRFEALISQLKMFGSNVSTLRDLREELLALRYLNLYEQIERILSKQLKQGLQQVVIELEELCENRPAQLVRALETVQKRVRKRDASLHIPFMTFAEYEQLGRKRAPNFLHSRQDIHAIAVWYQEQLQKQGMWDEIDLTRAALQSMERSPEQEHRFEFVACDEVQDFTDIQLSLIFRLVADPRHLLLAGDPKQIINPSGFRWEEVRQMFYDRHLDVPGVHHLTLNFRCVGSIVLLANSLLRLKQRLLGMQRHEKLDQWKYQGRLPCLVESIPAETLLQQVRMTGADRIILTRTESERDHLKKELATELVMTIREAKGLEFGTVLLWRFASEAEDVWDTIIRNSARGLHEALLRHEINLLYVGITRARHNLIVYDGSRASVIWKAEGLRDHVFRTDDLQYLAQAWQVPSSREEWKDQGDYYLEHKRYRAAAECYRNAEQSQLMYRALARAAEEKRDFLAAAEHWGKTGEQHRAAASYEHAEEFGQAGEIWLQLGDEQGATRCQLRLLESQGKYGEIAEYWEAEGVVDKAIHYWQESKRPDRLAPLFEAQGKHCMAAKAYENAGAFEQAARLFKKSKMHAEAARCHENAGQWEAALRIWTKLKRDDDTIRCLTRLDDPIRLAAFFEKRKEWKKALQTYQRGWNEALKAQVEQDLQSIRPRGQGHARRAIRFVLLRRVKEAAAAWEKARHYRLAGLGYEEVKEYHLAGRCFEKAGEWLSAIKMYIQSPQEQNGRYLGVRRCVRKALLPDGAKLLKPDLEHCAARFAGQGCYEAASWILEVLEEKSEAALFAAMAGDVRRSIRLFDRFESFQKAAATFSRFGRHREGAEFFRRHASRGYFYFGGYELMMGYERLLGKWLDSADSADDVRVEIARHVIDHGYGFSIEFVLKTLEPLNYYDKIYTSCMDEYGSYLQSYPHELQTLQRDARRLQSEGRMAAAGLRFLWLGQLDDAERCWEQVPTTDHNLYCKEEAGLWKDVMQHLEKNNRFLQAARLAIQNGEEDLAEQLILRSGRLEEGGKLMQTYGYFLKAYEFYQRSGAKKKAARMLEKLKRYDEAAQLRRELGEMQRYERCRKRVMRGKSKKSQAPLFARETGRRATRK